MSESVIEASSTWPSIHVSVVVYNTWGDATNCLNSILGQDYPGVVRVSVWDNGDFSPACLEFRARGVVIGSLGANLGFGRGHNNNLLRADDDVVLVLNPDTVLPPGFLQGAVLSMRRLQARAIAPQLRNPEGVVERSCRRFPTVSTEIARAVGLDHFERFGTVLDGWDHSGERIVDQPPGAVLFLEGSLFRELKGFDVRFPLYFEDVDLCRRLAERGVDTFFTDSVHAVHAREGTARHYRTKSIFWIEYSRSLYIAKHFEGWRWVVARGASVAGVLLRAAFFATASVVRPRLKPRARGYVLAALAGIGGSETYWRGRML